MYVHTIDLPEQTKRLELTLQPIFPGVPARLEDVTLEDGGAFTARLFKDNLVAFGRSIVIMLIGIVFLLMSLSSTYIRSLGGWTWSPSAPCAC